MQKPRAKLAKKKKVVSKVYEFVRPKGKLHFLM